MFQVIRITGDGPRTSKATTTSEEIRADRNVIDEMKVGQDVAGDYAIEWSYGTFDALIEGLMQSAWATDVIKNGITPKSYTFEETLEMGATDSYSRFLGCMVNTMSLAITTRARVTGSIGLMGKREQLATAIVAGATYTTATTTPISTSSANVANLTLAAGTPVVRSLNLQVNNNLRTRPVVGDEFSLEFGSGRFDVTGTAEVYFEGNTLYQSVLDHGSAALAFTIGNATGEKYTFSLPKIIFGNGERQPGGNNDDVMLSLPFRAVFEPTEACTLMITRAVA